MAVTCMIIAVGWVLSIYLAYGVKELYDVIQEYKKEVKSSTIASPNLKELNHEVSFDLSPRTIQELPTPEGCSCQLYWAICQFVFVLTHVPLESTISTAKFFFLTETMSIWSCELLKFEFLESTNFDNQVVFSHGDYECS